MHPAISRFASQTYYENVIKDGVLIDERRMCDKFRGIWPRGAAQPLRFVDCRQPEQSLQGLGGRRDADRRSKGDRLVASCLERHPHSIANLQEARRIAEDAARLLRDGLAPSSLFVVTPYKAQEMLLWKLLGEELTEEELGGIKIGSVHSGQGTTSSTL